jgi:hypothetical protein
MTCSRQKNTPPAGYAQYRAFIRTHRLFIRMYLPFIHLVIDSIHSQARSHIANSSDTRQDNSSVIHQTSVIPSRPTVELFSCIQARDSCDLKDLSYQLPQSCRSSILLGLIQKILPIKVGGSVYVYSLLWMNLHLTYLIRSPLVVTSCPVGSSVRN